MAETMTLWFLVLVSLNSTWLIWHIRAAEVTSAKKFLFLDRHSAERDQSWAHHIPINFYSVLNKQYYRRFRRHAGKMALFEVHNRLQHPFEYARFV
ncbi:uncharacterized protein LOC108026953 [Drosophila biarmipes]|uniref:uncharacterized protein LOC108026953 n=1 Tax=Drosophila biarmipes TaxID=125945 RepID=UPI0007E85F85|nr:uncharacterized protein LOC108026953 [Drosophila biarmipes]